MIPKLGLQTGMGIPAWAIKFKDHTGTTPTQLWVDTQPGVNVAFVRVKIITGTIGAITPALLKVQHSTAANGSPAVDMDATTEAGGECYVAPQYTLANANDDKVIIMNIPTRGKQRYWSVNCAAIDSNAVFGVLLELFPTDVPVTAADLGSVVPTDGLINCK